MAFPSRTSAVVGDHVSRSLGFASAWRRFPGIDVRVARFPRDRRPRGQIPRDLRSRGKNRHANVNQGAKNHANDNLMERAPRQRQIHGTPATATAISEKTSRRGVPHPEGVASLLAMNTNRRRVPSARRWCPQSRFSTVSMISHTRGAQASEIGEPSRLPPLRQFQQVPRSMRCKPKRTRLPATVQKPGKKVPAGGEKAASSVC